MVIEFARDVFIPLGQAGADLVDDTRSWVDDNGHRLSDRLWLARQYDRQQIDNILRDAVVRGRDPIQVARDLEDYLTPENQLIRNPETGRLSRKAKRDAAGNVMRDAEGRIILDQPKGVLTRTPRGGAGNYAARRLARTEMTRAFGQATLQAAELNPMVEGIKWSLSGSHTESDVCNDNAGRSSRGMDRGEYRLSEVPRYPGHPNCRCVLSPVAVKDVDAVVAQLKAEAEALPEEQVASVSTTPASMLEQRAAEALRQNLIRAEDHEQLIAALRAGELSPSDIADFTRETDALLEIAEKRQDIGGAIDIANYATSRDELLSTVSDATQQWRVVMTDAERDAMNAYKMQQSGNINRYLRRGETVNMSPEGAQRLISGMDDAFAKAGEFDRDVKLFRGVSFNDNFANQVAPDEWRNLTPGQTITDKGFVSTTHKEGGVGFGSSVGRAQSGVRQYQLQIYAPKGTKGIATDWLTEDKIAGKEGEVLLNRGTSFLVRSVDEVANGQFKVALEVLP